MEAKLSLFHSEDFVGRFNVIQGFEFLKIFFSTYSMPVKFCKIKFVEAKLLLSVGKDFIVMIDLIQRFEIM